MSKTGENLEKSKRKMKCIKGNTERLKADFSEGTMESRRQPNNTLEVLKGEETCQQRILYPAKIDFKSKGKIKNFPKAKTEIIRCSQTCFMRNTKGILQPKDYNSNPRKDDQ